MGVKGSEGQRGAIGIPGRRGNGGGAGERGPTVKCLLMRLNIIAIKERTVVMIIIT